jgi:hypothetical protein
VNEEVTVCAGCEHRVIPGVACDGLQRACPHHLAHQPQPRARDRYAAALDRLGGASEYDVIRGDG